MKTRRILQALVTAFPEIDTDEPLSGADAVDRLNDLWPEIKAALQKGPNNGLDPLEQECMDGLMAAYDAWLRMERQHPDEIRDFVDPLHRLQDLLAVRVVRNIFPKGWPTHKIKSKEEQL